MKNKGGYATEKEKAELCDAEASDTHKNIGSKQQQTTKTPKQQQQQPCFSCTYKNYTSESNGASVC